LIGLVPESLEHCSPRTKLTGININDINSLILLTIIEL
jgi:hypothetical protein